MKLANREKSFPASPIRFLWPHAVEAKKRGIHVYHLNIGQPDLATPTSFLNAVKGFKEKVLPYGPSEGLPELREAIADYFKRFDVEIEPDEVFITTGGSEAILFTFLSVADYGDNILIPEPFYTNYIGFARMAGIEITPIKTRVEEGFHLPPKQEIEKLINERTKAILICSPNNPTGTVYTDEEIEMVVDIADRHGLFLLADEVYREFVFDGLSPKTVFNFSTRENIVILDSISKRFSACGARIGFVVTKNRELWNSLLRLGQARLCSPTMEQVGAIEGFRTIDTFIEEMRREYEKRRDAVLDELSKVEGVLAHKPQGTFYTILKLPIFNAKDFAIWLLKEFNLDGKTVMLAPAEDFYGTKGRGIDEVRLAFVLKEKDLRDAVRVLKEALHVYMERVKITK